MSVILFTIVFIDDEIDCTRKLLSVVLRNPNLRLFAETEYVECAVASLRLTYIASKSGSPRRGESRHSMCSLTPIPR